MKAVFPLIRFYHKDKGLNFFHMSGTGFSIDHKFSKNKKYEIDFCEIQKEQGDAAVRRHFIVCENNMFLPYFYSNIKKGWDILLDEECDVDSNFKDVDSINCISSIKYGLVKPVIVAYLERQSDVRSSFDYLHKKYSFDNVLIISANGCKNKCDKFVRNDVNGNICEISNENAHTEVTSQVKQAVAENKMVILLNVNKFVESWTISEMNVQLILRNIKSPDTFGQAICRPSRIYVHEKYVIKTDAFIFLYGDTFVTMSYKYDNIIRKNSDKKTTEPFSFISDMDAIYIRGNKYSYQERNLLDLRKMIDRRMTQLNIKADSLINNIIANKFPCFVDKLMKNNNVCFKKLTGIISNVHLDITDEKNDQNNNENEQTETGNVDIVDNVDLNENEQTETGNVDNNNDLIETEDEKNASTQLKQLKTFLSKLQLEAITNCYLGSFDYDTLVKGVEEHMISDRNNFTEYMKIISNSFECENDYALFKKIIENWLEEQYCD